MPNQAVKIISSLQKFHPERTGPFEDPAVTEAATARLIDKALRQGFISQED